ncbi:HugZ family protein [Congregibacter sp.]|uniref:HugZ family pyridoxamine 5'-phosphate oxidase n=1 Tax=Congregibacter sp. TaxID=2744308 RepID=UPI003F6D631D
MKNTALQQRLSDEITDFLDRRRSLQLATIDESGLPFASYAPFARDDRHLYVLLSDIAVHGINLARNPRASALIIEDEDTADELYARIRVCYQMKAEELEVYSSAWENAVKTLANRHGERPRKLSQLSDFRLFRLSPLSGRYVKGFGKAYSLSGGSLSSQTIDHLRVGHQAREDAAA